MDKEQNPYESPIPAEADAPPAESRCLGFWTFALIAWWVFEGGWKICLLAYILWQGFNPLPQIADLYHTSNLLLFVAAAWLITIETIGPWIGVYYLIRNRACDNPFDASGSRILKVASGLSLFFSLGLVLCIELFAAMA